MATYYVIPQVGGASDSNNGTSTSTPWLTIQKAATTMVAGDTVHIAGGQRYQELVTPANSGSSGSDITYNGDVTGANTGYGGVVEISAHDSNSAVAARNYAFNLNGKKFIVCKNITFNGSTSGATGAVYSGTGSNDNFEGVVFQNCAMIAGSGSNAANFLYGTPTTPTANGLTLDKCAMLGRVYIEYSENATAQQDLKILIKNCILVGASRSNGVTGAAGIIFNRLSTGTHGVGGLSVYNCNFFGHTASVYFFSPKSTTYPCYIRNSLFIGTNDAPILNSGGVTANAVYYSNCRFHGGVTAASGTITDGGGNDSSCDIGMLGGIADMPIRNLLGYSPYRPWEPMALNDGTSLNDCIGNASATYAPDDDIYGSPRPMGRNTDDIGAVEANARQTKDTSNVFGTGDSGAFATGAGFKDFWRPVAASSTTISVNARYDSNYTGTKPTLTVMNIPGVADQTDVMTSAANTTEALSVTFTPTATGWVRVRLQGFDTSATGKCFFKDLA